MKVYKAINAIQKALSKTGIGKDHKNAQQGYSFRGIDDVYNALAPLLAEHGLLILPRVLTRTESERASKAGGALFSVVVDVEFDFISSEDGSRHTVKIFGEAMDSADKATNKALSAAYKYACLEAFAIPTEGENDADARTHEVAARPQVSEAVKQTFQKAPEATSKGAPLSTANMISQPQAKRFYAIAKGGGKSDDEIKAYMREFCGAERTEFIPRDKYEAACLWAGEKPAEVPF